MIDSVRHIEYTAAQYDMQQLLWTVGLSLTLKGHVEGYPTRCYTLYAKRCTLAPLRYPLSSLRYTLHAVRDFHPRQILNPNIEIRNKFKT